MKITAIECHVVAVPGLESDACTSAQDDVVVLVHTDEGTTGVGEVDTNPWMAKAMIDSPGISDSVLRDTLADDGLTMVDGHIQLPSRPGLGLTLNEDALREYCISDSVEGRTFVG